MHPQRVVLLLNVARANQAHVGQPIHDGLFRSDNFRRAVPTGRVFVEVDDGEGFYQLPVIHFASESTFNGFGVTGERIT